MNKHADQFAAYCRQVLDFDKQISYEYRSLSLCILDCVYSLRAQYSTTKNVVKRYAEQYLDGCIDSPNDTVTSFINHISEAGGPIPFAFDVLGNKQRSGHVLKSEVCLNLARYLRYLHIETIDDFSTFEAPELLEAAIKAVKGIGDAGTDYLFMLAGDQNRCKLDVHISRFIKEACGIEVNNEECQSLFSEAVKMLKKDYPFLTIAKLDGIIWRKYHENDQ